MLDKNVINQKLEGITVYLKELDPILKITFKEFFKNYQNIRTAERDFQLIVDNAVDINNQIALSFNKPPAENNFQSFIQIGELGALPQGFGKKLAPSAGLRNRLVHEYEKIDPNLFYKSLKYFIPLYKKYCQNIYNYNTAQR
jgi:uncharacterized protein YutE (UPF0331/DUF86 family)